MIKKVTNYRQLMSRNSKVIGTDPYRSMLINIHPKCYVEAKDGNQRGTVTKVVRDAWGVPVKVKTISGGREDCIQLDEVEFFEPYYPTIMAFVDKNHFYVLAYPSDGEPERVW